MYVTLRGSLSFKQSRKGFVVKERRVRKWSKVGCVWLCWQATNFRKPLSVEYPFLFGLGTCSFCESLEILIVSDGSC